MQGNGLIAGLKIRFCRVIHAVRTCDLKALQECACVVVGLVYEGALALPDNAGFGF